MGFLPLLGGVFSAFIKLSDDLDFHIGLALGHPEYPLLSQRIELLIIYISPIHHGYVSGLHVPAQLTHVAAIMMIGLICDYANRNERDQIERDMYFCCRFVFPVLGPVHALGNQFDSC